MRVRLVVAYHGAAYHGWQIQSGVPTVEGVLSDAVAIMTGAPTKVWGASRTDAGVHAIGQVAAFDTELKRDPRAWYRGLNHNLPDDVSIRSVDLVPESFHPRHSARGKIYHYDLWPCWDRAPFFNDRALHVRRKLDVEAMQRAARVLVGQHDFSAFQASGCDAISPIRRLWEVSVQPLEDGRVRIAVAGSAFLKYMVRNIVGTLVMVGKGQRPADWVTQVLESRDRGQAGPTAAAHGLTLVRVFHPDAPVKEKVQTSGTTDA